MAWTIRFDPRFERDLRTLDRSIQLRIVRFLEERVVTAADPRSLGKPLGHELASLWRYRVGDYRVLCKIDDGNLIILALAVGHRSSVYKR